MWSPLSKLLEVVAAFRLPYLAGRENLVVGNPMGMDSRGTMDWKEFLNPRALSAVWAPHPHGPWTPFHCITLFVALDHLDHKNVGSGEADHWPFRHFTVPDWIDANTLLIIDLPGPRSVALGASLALSGCDLVCTFNNWPHPKGVLRAQDTLGALLRYAGWLRDERVASPTPGPVAWLCDMGRMGQRIGAPGDFDNRYYLEESLFPGPKYLREQGISRVVLVDERPTLMNTDVAVQLFAYQKEGIEILRCIADINGKMWDPRPFKVPQASFSPQGFYRSSAGGFGSTVPQPSSGGGG
jgi:hypothetical protein